MKSPKIHFVAGAVFMVLLMMAFNHAGSAQQHPGVPIGAGIVDLTIDHVIPGSFDVRAFVETGSLSRNCLVTLAETNFVRRGWVVFCAPRNFLGHKGVLVSVFMNDPPPPDLIIAVTVYQERAHGYGPPVLFPLN